MRTRHRRRATPNASVFLSKGQLLAVLLILGAIAVSSWYRPRLTVTVVVAGCMAFYIVTALFRLVITLAGRNYRPPRRIRVWPGDPTLPAYAVLLPVHKEANMLRHLVSRVDKLAYPRQKLRVLLLIEHDDLETLEAARRLRIPFYRGPGQMAAGGYLRVVVIPPGGPKTKPNAMNVAMNIVVREGCEFVTVYDAEDRPEPDLLLKAVGAFRAATMELACLQAELAFWNDNTNWVTALYWIGYKIHFTRLLPSITMEEAPVTAKAVDKQQRRWKAGYLQTGLVHTRRPLRSMRKMGLGRWLCFNLLMLGVPISFLLNPLFVALTVVYFATRSQLIAALFPTPVYYSSVALMLLGNLGLLYELMHTCLEEAEHARGRFDLMRYMLMAQLMWLWMSRSTYIAVFELVTGKRAWHKTPHGHAEAEEAGFRDRRLPRQPVPPGWQAGQPVSWPAERQPGWPAGRTPRQPASRPAGPLAGRLPQDRHWAESA